MAKLITTPFCTFTEEYTDEKVYTVTNFQINNEQYLDTVVNTLDKKEVGIAENVHEGDITMDIEYYHKHTSGWRIFAKLQADYFIWIEDFQAYHEKWGKIWGSFATKLFYEKSGALQDFLVNHKPVAFDMADI